MICVLHISDSYRCPAQFRATEPSLQSFWLQSSNYCPLGRAVILSRQYIASQMRQEMDPQLQRVEVDIARASSALPSDLVDWTVAADPQ